MDYFIIDKISGIYITETSLKNTEKGLILFCYSGCTSGLEFYSNRERAEQAAEKIMKDFESFGLHRNLEICRGDIFTMNAGELVMINI